MKKIALFLIISMNLSLNHSNIIVAQSIRKDYREFTSKEMSDYRLAINALRVSGIWFTLASDHSNHFNSIIHTRDIQTQAFTGEQFLPWHRFFLLNFEWYVRNATSTTSYLSVPYWDWRTDNTVSSVWHTDFLSISKLPGFTFTRCLPGSSCAASGSFPYLANTVDINNCLNLSSFWLNTLDKSTFSTDFSHRLEHYHDRVHVWVGGTMNQQASPNDPIFYLHHNMIDKIWQDWEDRSTGLQSSFPVTGSVGMVHYTAAENGVDVLANDMKDSRAITNTNNSLLGRANDVWFAFNKKVILDGANGSDFVCNDGGDSYLYRYTAATSSGASTVVGSMYVGDVRRDAIDDIVSDNKGGFRIESNARVDFRSGKDISFRPGFWAKGGAKVTAKIITSPDGFTSNGDVSQREIEESEQSMKPKFDYVIYPNPSSIYSMIDVLLPNTSNELSIDLYDMIGNKIKTVTNSTYGQGTQTFQVDMQNFENGIYLCVIRCDGKNYTQKIILQK